MAGALSSAQGRRVLDKSAEIPEVEVDVESVVEPPEKKPWNSTMMTPISPSTFYSKRPPPVTTTPKPATPAGPPLPVLTRRPAFSGSDEPSLGKRVNFGGTSSSSDDSVLTIVNNAETQSDNPSPVVEVTTFADGAVKWILFSKPTEIEQSKDCVKYKFN